MPCLQRWQKTHKIEIYCERICISIQYNTYWTWVQLVTERNQKLIRMPNQNQKYNLMQCAGTDHLHLTRVKAASSNEQVSGMDWWLLTSRGFDPATFVSPREGDLLNAQKLGQFFPVCFKVWNGKCAEMWFHCNKPRLFYLVKGPILNCFSSISHSCQRSKNSLFDMHCPKPIPGPEFQLSKSRSTELYSEQSVSVPAPLNANKLCLSTPTWRALPATSLSGRRFPLR